MDAVGCGGDRGERGRSGGSRSSSSGRRGGAARVSSSTGGLQYSTSSEDEDGSELRPSRGSRSANRQDRESSLHGHTPVGCGTTDEDHEFTGGGVRIDGSPGQFTNPNLLPPDYYPPAYSSSSGGDHYDSRRPNNRRLPPSVSSSDNNSDTTYAESGDLNSSLRARMQVLDNELAGTPPDPAPPEVPPRGPSHHHPLLTAQRRAAQAAQTGGGSNGACVLSSISSMNGSGAPGMLTTMSGGQPSPPHYQENPDDNYQQPSNSVFLSHEYLMNGTNVRYGGTMGGPKSPGGSAFYGPPPGQEFSPTSKPQPRSNCNHGSQSYTNNAFQQPHDIMAASTSSCHKENKIILSTLNSSKGMNSPGAGALPSLTSLPVVRTTLGSRGASLSGRGLALGKTWPRLCSWRCACAVLALLCCVLAALLAYFAAVASLTGTPRSCLVVEDAAQVIAADAEHPTPPPARQWASSEPPTTAPARTSSHQQQAKDAKPSSPDDGGEGSRPAPQPKGTSVLVKNKKYDAVVPPNDFWNVQLDVKQPVLVRIILTVRRSSTLAVYGRRNVAPSITQYDFVQFIKGGRSSRARRDTLEENYLPLDPSYYNQGNLWFNSAEYDSEKNEFPTNSEENFNSYLLSEEYWEEYDEGDDEEFYKEPPEDLVYFPADEETDDEDAADDNRIQAVKVTHDDRVAEAPVERRPRRYVDLLVVNATLLHRMNTGRWYLAVYNDAIAQTQVSLMLEEDGELQSECPSDCSGRGSCVLGRCECVHGWVGHDCSTSVCPVLCSSHGQYGGGVCHCDQGWKGRECDVPDTDCEVPDCGGKGTCRNGACHCHAGWKGVHCEHVDCLDPSCSGHGGCVLGQCVCQAGWTGVNCSQVDHKVFTCLPDCSGHGHYDLHASKCVCDSFWTGDNCNQPRCEVSCLHGRCGPGGCVCERDWTGERCDQRSCDPRCAQHGQCHNGTCLCIQGWNGRHCTMPGCVSSCSGHGLCTTQAGEYRCQCSAGWTGADCSVQLETECGDMADNDGDGLADCSDSDCCWAAVCNDHVMCMMSSDPVDVLLTKQPPAVTASFYQRVKFIIEDRHVQNFARKDQFEESLFWSSFTPRRVSVIRGRVVSANGEGIVGVRTSVDKQSTKYGITATRRGGWFDVLVNGGGAVTLQFQRVNFLPLTVTVPAPWNGIVVLEPIKLTLKSEAAKELKPLSVESLWSSPCLDHDHQLLQPQVVATHLPYTVGGVPHKSVVFTEMQVVQESVSIPGSDLHLLYHSNSAAGYYSRLLLELTPTTIPPSLTRVHLKITVEGSVFEKLFEADPNITYTFTWNKRNVYKQKVYGVSSATVAVGFEYETCRQIVWETQTAILHGFYMEIADVGGWNLNIHHMYNFESGVLQRGDGSILDLMEFPRLVTPLVGTGSRRPETCHHCSGRAIDAQLLAPTALAAAPDGSVYVGDFNLIRRVTKDGKVYTVLQLSSTQVSYNYHLTVSPVDGHVYVSDAEKYKVVRVTSLDDVSDPATNYEDVAGNGGRCVPGDEHRCGDGGPAVHARLSHPKGLAIAPDRTLYIADGPNLRVVDADGVIHTLIGHHGHKTRWRQLPCKGAIPVGQVDLQWPSSIALSPLDGTLHILDDHVLLQVTQDGSVRVRAGSPLHCQVDSEIQRIGTITGLAFSPSGDLYIIEEMSSGENRILELNPSDKMKIFAGATLEDCGCVNINNCNCGREKVPISTRLLLKGASDITVTPDGIIHISDQKVLQVFSLSHYLPSDDQNGDYQVANPRTNEVYTFSRHGHHVETRDLVTGRILYSFLYSKNTSFGRLSTVTDSSGNKVEFLRDYSSAVSQIENTLGEKFAVEISRLGLMTKFSERTGRHYEFTYNDETGLLTAVTTPGRLTTVYQYDLTGRVVAVIAPTGSRTVIRSWIGGSANGSNKMLSVGIGRAADEAPDHTLSLTQDRTAYFTHGEVTSSIHLNKNGSWHQILPWGGRYAGISSFSNPLLEMTLPTQARLLPSTKQFLAAASGSTTSSLLDVSYGVMGDHRGAARHVETVMLVNRSRVLSSRWDGALKQETLRDGSGEPLLQSNYNNHLKPTVLSPGYSLPNVNLTYDRYGRPGRMTWSRLREEYEYDANGLLSSVTTASAAVTRYSFSYAKLPVSITLPSGRSWELKYNEYGGLNAINTPSGTAHLFSVQASFSAFVFSYVTPGSTQAYRQHLDPDGRLLLTDFPDSSAKILFTYTPCKQLDKIVSGDGMTQFVYGSDGLLSEAIHDEMDLEYKMDYSYQGRLLQEHRIEYSARSSLSNVKFTYEYDANMRITKMDGRVGGQTLKPFHMSFSPRNGSPSTIGSFLVSRPEVNITTIQDGTAIFTRHLDDHLRVSSTSLNIHNMQVFRQQISYNRDGRIGQVNTFTRNYHTKPYSNSKNFSYDADGQLTSVEAKESWSFAYDANGNMVSLTYSTNTIPMQYDNQDRIVKFGEGIYKYNFRGAISQNAREVTYQYNAKGLMIQAAKPGRFNIRYLYDHDDRLIARKDNFGNVTQFLYQDPRHPDRVTHIYNTRDASLLSLVYDDRGHLIFVQVHLNQYYVATDENGTPVMAFNRYGEVAREIMRSPYGHIIYDSNPYLYLPISYAGGILDSTTELVHMARGRVYDPLIGQWLSPNWESIASNIMKPSQLSLYRFNGNDPINIGKTSWTSFERRDWLKLLGYDMKSLIPSLTRTDVSNFKSLESWSTIQHVPIQSVRKAVSPFQGFVQDVPCVYGQIELLKEGFLHTTRLGVLTSTGLRKDFWPDTHKVELANIPGPFGEGLLVSNVEGKAVVTATPNANPIFRDVLTSVFNNSHLLDVTLTSHGTYVFYFVKENVWRATEDMTQLNRLAGEVNITKPSDEGSDKFIDVKLRTNYAVVHVRYGSSPLLETKRLLKHAKKLTVRRAWAAERELVSSGFTGQVEWSSGEREELLASGSVGSYTARYLHPPETYPQLIDDPTNIRFFKDTKRTRRNSRAHRSRRCRKWWWRGYC